MNIVFMGTPDIAAASLAALLAAGHRVAAVYTRPDKPVGRKQILTAPPVKQLAERHGITVEQVTRDFACALRMWSRCLHARLPHLVWPWL